MPESVALKALQVCFAASGLRHFKRHISLLPCFFLHVRGCILADGRTQTVVLSLLKAGLGMKHHVQV